MYNDHFTTSRQLIWHIYHKCDTIIVPSTKLTRSGSQTKVKKELGEMKIKQMQEIRMTKILRTTGVNFDKTCIQKSD